MFIPHVNTGHIYIIKGDNPDIRTFSKVEWVGKRTVRALEQAIAKERAGGKFWAFVQYEDERTPLMTTTPTELLRVGVLKNKATALNDASIMANKSSWADTGLTGRIPPRKKVIEIR
jgi:hypothetical protein